MKRLIRNIPIIKNFYVKLHNLKSEIISKKVYKKLIAIEHKSETEIHESQEKLLNKFLLYAYENTIFYKNLFDQHSAIEQNKINLKSIPILTKDIIRLNKSNLISKKFNVQNLGQRQTGGSTGEPFHFYANTSSGFYDYGHHAFLYHLMGYKKGDVVISCGGFEIPRTHIKNGIFWERTFKGNLFGEYRFSVLYLNDQTISEYARKIIEIKPSVLRGYPSFFDRIAKYLQSNNLEIDFKIKGINLTSELCTEQQRINIEQTFKSMVYFEYGHKEICVYCYTKDNSYEYYSSPIYGYVEVINEDNSETQIGETGKIIVTGFNNYGMPFVRYDTGDLGILSYRKGGIVKFKKIIGRDQDYLIDLRGNKVHIIGFIYTGELDAFSRFDRWQFYQKTPGKALIKVIKKENFRKRDEEEILNYFNRFENITFSIKYVDQIPISKSGKHLFLVNELIKNKTNPE